MKRLLISYILFLSFFNSQAQDKFSSLDVSFDYFSNTNTFGQFNQITKQPSYSPSVSFFQKSGFNASLISNIVENSDSTLENSTYEFDFMIGYYYTFKKYFTVFPTYTRYFYSDESNSLKSSFTDNLTIDFSVDYKNSYSGISSSYLLGESNELFITAYSSYNINFEKVLFDHSFLMIQPEVNFNFGNQTYYNNYIWDNLQNDSEYRDDFLSQRGVQRLINYLQRQYPNATEDQILALLVARQTEVEDEFNLSSIGLSLPLAYMIGSFTLNTSFSTYFLVNKPDYIEEDYQTYFSIGLSYSFMWE